MLKKFSIASLMCLTLGLGASQLIASQRGDSSSLRECYNGEYKRCPSTNQGGSLNGCIYTYSTQLCTYSNGTIVRLSNR